MNEKQLITIITQDYSSTPCAELVINNEDDNGPFGCAELEMRAEFFDWPHQRQVELLQGWIKCVESLLKSVEAGEFQDA